MATEGWNWTQLSMSRAGNFPKGGVKRLSAEDVRTKGAMWVWHTTFARSIPAVVSGLAAAHAERFAGWSLADYKREWGQNEVVVAYSDDVRFNHGVEDATYGRVVLPRQGGQGIRKAKDFQTDVPYNHDPTMGTALDRL